MGYKVRVAFGYRVFDHGQGLFGKGKPYKTVRGAEKRAKELRTLHRLPAKKVKIVPSAR